MILRLISAVTCTAIWLLQAWWAMILVGVAHANDDRVPAFGFSTMVCLTGAGSAVVALHHYQEKIREAAR